MTLPYPDSPDVDENIATSIERIQDNLNYLDGLVGSGQTYTVVSINADLATKSGVQTITGVPFQPKGLLCFAMYLNSHMTSHGAATQYSTSTSVDSACVGRDHNYAGFVSSTGFCQLYMTTGSYIVGSASVFTNDGVRISWTKTGTPAGTVGEILYIFFG